MQYSQSFTFIHFFCKRRSNSVNPFNLIHFYYNALRLFLSHILSVMVLCMDKIFMA